MHLLAQGRARVRHGVVRIGVVAVALLFMGVLVARPCGAEVIQSFDADLWLKADGTLEVTETIEMDFEDAHRHGIFRHIPVRYSRYGSPYNIWLKLRDVTENQNPAPYTTSTRSGQFSVRIGDPDRTASGLHTYRIRYSVRRAVNYFNGAPEVYWNATGNEWPFRIRRASVRLHPPPGVDPADVKTASFMGPPGSTKAARSATADDAVTYDALGLAPGSGLTVVAGLPAGSVRESMLSTIGWWLADWWPAVVIPLVALVLMAALWLKAGRDPDRGAAIAVEWNPPKDLSPAEVGTLIDESCDMPDLVSTLIDLAARGYLTIKEVPGSKFLFFSNRDYQFVQKLPPPGSPPLLPHERQFLKGLFGGAGKVRYLSALKEEFYVHLPGIRAAVYDSLTAKGFFTANPQTIRTFYKSVAYALLILTVVVLVWGYARGQIAYGVGLGLAGLVVLACTRAMPAKTFVGSRTLRECRGFQRFLSLVERDRIATIARDDPTIFGRLLPYAMVLGVADQWANAFRDLLKTPPDWYVAADPYSGFSPHIFVHDLGSGLNTMSRIFTSKPPSSSGWSGGAGGGFSGFSGGSSGGGFGGGGGGSW